MRLLGFAALAAVIALSGMAFAAEKGASSSQSVKPAVVAPGQVQQLPDSVVVEVQQAWTSYVAQQQRVINALNAVLSELSAVRSELTSAKAAAPRGK